MMVILPSLSIAQLQSKQRPALSIGLKADLQSAGIANQNNYGQNEMDYGVNLGFGAGASVTYFLNPKHALLLELSYQTAGQSYDDTFNPAVAPSTGKYRPEKPGAVRRADLAFEYRFIS